MLSLETRSRSRDISRSDFCGLGLGLGLVGPCLGLGLGRVGPGLGLARSGLDVETETEISSKHYTYKKCRPTKSTASKQQQDCYRRKFVIFKPCHIENL